MSSVDARPVTIEQVLKSPPEGSWELVDGELVLKMAGGRRHGRVALEVGGLIGIYVEQERLGEVYATGTGFILARDPDTMRVPDVSIVRADRLPDEEEGFLPLAPDLAVEVVSPNDRPGEVHEKVEQWLAAGTRLVWVIWPETRSVTVHRADAERRILHEDDEMTGEDVIPGFTCRIVEFFG